jgi:uncharacterized protein YcbK (DUF882 family)
MGLLANPNNGRYDQGTMAQETCCTRNVFLRGGMGAALGLALPRIGRAAAAVPYPRRTLWLTRDGYDEEVRAPFTVDGRTVYIPGYEEICWLLRDHQVPESEGYVRFDVVTIEVLWEVQTILQANGIDRPLNIHSGYRTPETNARTEHAAHLSQHLVAKAADFSVEGVAVADLWRIVASRARAGGIGYYPRGTGVHADDGWIHVDSRAQRVYWPG